MSSVPESLFYACQFANQCERYKRHIEHGYYPPFYPLLPNKLPQNSMVLKRHFILPTILWVRNFGKPQRDSSPLIQVPSTRASATKGFASKTSSSFRSSSSVFLGQYFSPHGSSSRASSYGLGFSQHDGLGKLHFLHGILLL